MLKKIVPTNVNRSVGDEAMSPVWPFIVRTKFTVSVAIGMIIRMLAAMLIVTRYAGTGPPLSRVIAVRPPRKIHDQNPILARL